jgi:hypothetical protein
MRASGRVPHTPGPWEVCDLDFRAIEGPDGRIVADLRSFNPSDAALVAAAPEMLAALKRVYPLLTDKAAKEEIGALLNSIEDE